jgi:hypothetical protein
MKRTICIVTSVLTALFLASACGSTGENAPVNNQVATSSSSAPSTSTQAPSTTVSSDPSIVVPVAGGISKLTWSDSACPAVQVVANILKRPLSSDISFNDDPTGWGCQYTDDPVNTDLFIQFEFHSETLSAPEYAQATNSTLTLRPDLGPGAFEQSGVYSDQGPFAAVYFTYRGGYILIGTEYFLPHPKMTLADVVQANEPLVRAFSAR